MSELKLCPKIYLSLCQRFLMVESLQKEGLLVSQALYCKPLCMWAVMMPYVL